MPKTNRLKPEVDIATRAEFETVLDNIANAQLERDAMVLERDNELLQIREEFDPKINAMNDRMNAMLLRAERFASVHREELFGKLKSAATALTNYGFRLGNPVLNLLNRKWNWKLVLDALKAKKLAQFIVIKESPDKDAMKAQLKDVQLAEVGCRLDQDDAFFVEPKRDAIADRRLVSDGKGVGI
jgi:phage host-nuclease inhibitor protein Gam